MKYLSKMLGSIITIILLSPAVWADTLTIPNTFTGGAKITINDNDNRITATETKTPAVGRILVPVTYVFGEGATLNSINSAILPAAVLATAIGSKYTKPNDYVSGDDITLKAIISGCPGSTIAHEANHPAVMRANIGVNLLLPGVFGCIDGSCPTVSMPVNAPSTVTIVAVSRTLESFADINIPSFTRRGDDVYDDCAGDMTVHGFIIEYSKGRKRGQ